MGGGGGYDLHGLILSEALTCAAKSSPLNGDGEEGGGGGGGRRGGSLVFAAVVRGGVTSTRQL